jgi:glucose/arabinose dehydrogenase
MLVRRSAAAVAGVLVAITIAGCTDEGQPASTAPILSTTTSTASTTTVEVPNPSTTATTVTVTTSTITPTTTLPLEELGLDLVRVAEGFEAPVLLIADPDGGPDLVVEQPGRIVRLDPERTIALDISDDVIYGGEQGLLGLAFHPDFAERRLAYVNYVGDGRRTVIEQFVVGDDGRFDLGSRTRILEIDQPASNHNGGMVAFGPDGYLWIGMGDGGGADDRFGQGQRPDTLLGAMLRIAVGVDGVDTYAIPPDNPYADGSDGAPEVWAIGLRNPWRFSFDGDTVWIADVGQRDIEEVSAVSVEIAGANYGWPMTEGSSCFRSSSCDQTSLVQPLVEYDHGDGCSITGGFVYRGTAIPELDGHYLYSDFCTGFLRSHADGEDFDWTDRVGATRNVSGFGVGGDGELYVVSLSGTIDRLERIP